MLQRFFIGFIRVHILYHASQAPIFGLEIIQELARHGYRLSPGTLYPILHHLEREDYLRSERLNVGGRIRRLYVVTEKGNLALAEARQKVLELFSEIFEDKPQHPSPHTGERD